MSKINISSRRKVVDIESLSIQELEEIKKQSDKKIHALRNIVEDMRETASLTTGAAAVTTIGTIIQVLTSGPIENPAGVTTLLLLECAGMALPTLRRIVKGKKLDSQIDEEMDFYRDVDCTRERKRDADAHQEEKKKVDKELVELYNALIETERDDYQDSLIHLEMETLIEDGADKKILMMPAIQKIFDVAMKPLYNGEHRVFIHDKYVKDIKPDGTFTIATHKKPIYCLIENHHDKLFAISYCKDQDEDHYLQVDYERKRIYIDKNGQITSIVGRVDSNYLHSEITLPFTGKVIAEGQTVEQFNKLNAAMASMRQIESELRREREVPTIDFEKIGRADGTIGEGYSQSTDVPVIEVPEQRQEGGFRR